MARTNCAACSTRRRGKAHSRTGRGGGGGEKGSLKAATEGERTSEEEVRSCAGKPRVHLYMEKKGLAKEKGGLPR